MTLHQDDEIRYWVFNLYKMNAGGFLIAIGLAAQSADFENYALMRPLLLELEKKYPEYGGPTPEIGRSA